MLTQRLVVRVAVVAAGLCDSGDAVTGVALVPAVVSVGLVWRPCGARDA